MSSIAKTVRPIAGNFGFLVGACALILVMVNFWAGPFAPQQDASVSIGEIAADIRQAAKRALSGEAQPDPVSAPWDIDRVLGAVAATLAGLAVILGLAGFVRRETWRPAAAAMTLGVSAVVFQLFTWMVLVVVGCIILYAIIQNIDGILGG